MQLFRILPFICLTVFPVSAVLAKLGVIWPTEHPPTDMEDSFYQLLQPTESREIQSGNFGCVRTDGRQFHEGIDLKAFTRDSRGEPTDRVRSVLPGVVVYVNSHHGKSSYGRYILIEHNDGEMNFLSLYAHLRSVGKGIIPGKWVKAGEAIGVMGRSASYTIPRERAHLHFEVCLRMTDRFQNWYDWKDFDSRNDHGIHNGMNLTAVNPAVFLEQTQWQHKQTFRQVLEAEDTAVTLLVSTTQVPDFLTRYPALVDGIIPQTRLAGWQIEFTYYGLPKKWTPLISNNGPVEEGKIALKDFDESLLSSNSCRHLIRFQNGKPTIGSGLQTTLQLLFGYR
ncbi:MAG: M23 family metallopeptidase [Verrucomicrobiae bacterium]|nr:M23 family metallopeptidase [Verrucomicrobiae bacterium]